MRLTTILTRLSVVALAAGLAMASAAPAYAAPPSNDTFGGAVPIGSVPFNATVDTTEATTDADDAATNTDCGAPATDASVWYSFTAATDQILVADVGDSSYTAGGIVVTGAPGSFSLVACGPDAVPWQAVAGTTYHLLLFDDQFDGGGNGGTLVLSVFEAPPPPAVDVTANANARFDPSNGSATVTGTITCTGGPSEFTIVQVELRQKVGRGEVFGVGFVEVQCDGVARPWSVEVMPIFGRKFAGGKAASLTIGFSCGPVFCGEDFEERIVHLSRR